MDTQTSTHTKVALELKSTSFSVPVLVVFDVDPLQLEQQITQKIAQAPEFFKDSPILIDLKICNQLRQTLNLARLIDYLRQNKLLPIGISGGTEQQNNTALDFNIPLHAIRQTHATKKYLSADSLPSPNSNPKTSGNSNEYLSPTHHENTAKTTTAPTKNILIAHPVRSGQRIYAKGDLTVLSNVSAGAEIIAEGNIHVYGTLRGKALAGVRGNTSSRIFCSKLCAELVSIDGHYKISEKIDKAIEASPAQIYLQGQVLVIKNL